MIPPFQELMLPELATCAAAAPEDVANRMFIEKLADLFQLTDEDRKDCLRVEGTAFREPRLLGARLSQKSWPYRVLRPWPQPNH